MIKDIKELNTPEKLLKFMSKNIKYGFLTKRGEVESDNFNNIGKDYVLQTPQQVFKNKVGICWDQTYFEEYVFRNVIKQYKYKIFYIIQDNEICGNHTFLVYQDKNNLYYFENSYKKCRGIHKFRNYNDIINHVIDNMRDDYHDNKIRVYEITSLPKFGSDTLEFMNFCEGKRKILELEGDNMNINESTNKKERFYKCPYCDEKLNRTDLVYHVDEEHEDMIPQDYTASRLVFNYINKKESGKCIMCKKETKWNEKVWRYDRLCSNKCHDEYVKLVKSRMVNKYGKEHILDDPEQQKKMLSNRKISGTYKFSDGGVREYVGSYERKLLEFYDKVLQVPSKDILTPGPIVEYEFKGKKHTWITDLYYVPANLVHDVKDGGDNPNNREMGEYRAKQEAKEKAIAELDKYNYIRLTDNNFQQLLLILSELKELMMDNKEDIVIRINEEVAAGAVANTSAENNVYIIPYYMNNAFIGTALSLDKYMKDLYMIKDGKISKGVLDDIKDYDHYMYKYIGECNIEEILTDEENLSPDYFYTKICNKKLLDSDQFDFDECLEPELNGYTEHFIKKSILEFSLEHQSRELDNSNIYFECNIEDYKLKSILSRNPRVTIMEDVNGYFAYNKSLETRTPSYDTIHALYNTISILNDYKV